MLQLLRESDFAVIDAHQVNPAIHLSANNMLIVEDFNAEDVLVELNFISYFQGFSIEAL